jgi:DNA polymerase I-like protein with 3'-5' exonuclease and polymerase domains
VRTGRLSCCRPNLQNLPKVQNIGTLQISVRSLLRASSAGFVLLSADYSQIEMRVFAHVTNDAALIELFAKGGDVYVALAADVFSKPASVITDEERGRAKVICLGVMYGMGAVAAAAKMGVTVQQATSIMRNFFAKYSRAKQWMEELKNEARSNGFIVTISGRRRYLDSADLAFERQAVNSVIQGSASDIIKAAMLCLSSALEQVGGDVQGSSLLLQVHDELVLQCPSSENAVRSLSTMIRRCMQQEVADMLGISKIPLPVSISVGSSFGSQVQLAG